MRFTSALILAFSTLTTFVAAATTTTPTSATTTSISPVTGGENPITYPLGGTVKAGSDVTITWTATSGNSCNLVLRKGKDTDLDEVLDIATGIPNTGAFTWSVPSNLQAGTDYSIQIATNDDDNYSPMFTIDSDVTSTSSSTSSLSSSSTSTSSSSTSTSTSESSTSSGTTSAFASASTTATTSGSSNSSSTIRTSTRPTASASSTPDATTEATSVNSGSQLASPLALVLCIFAGLMYLN